MRSRHPLIGSWAKCDSERTSRRGRSLVIRMAWLGCLVGTACGQGGADGGFNAVTDGGVVNPIGSSGGSLPGEPSAASPTMGASEGAGNPPSATSTSSSGSGSMGGGDGVPDGSSGGPSASDATLAATDGAGADDGAPPGEGALDGSAPSPSMDGGAPLPEASPPVPSCSQTCATGCCDTAGACIGGRSDTACGMHGASCMDCTVHRQTCQSNVCADVPVMPGVDAGSPPDAGSHATDAAAEAAAPGCEAAKCSNFCVPSFVQCCKSNGQCGCTLSSLGATCF